MSCEIEGYNEFESLSHHRARKPHKCCACGEPIRVGHRYERIAFKWEGEFESLLRCLRCSAMASACQERLRREDAYDEGVAYRLDCGHEWSDRFEEEPPPEVARLAFMTADEAQAEFARLEEK
ncbi:MAG TPA: hypothetical protein VKO62_00110 [Solirubrobacterales bacterium]|nr:hypothetical protein [Solirubrobacterales bacterium]